MKIVVNAVFGLFSRLKHRQPSFLLLFWEEKQSKRNFPILTQNHGLTPIWHPKNESQSFRYFSRLKHRQTSFLILFWPKTLKKSFIILSQNHGLTTSEKSNMAPQNESLCKRSFSGLFSRLKHRQKYFLILFWQKQSKRNFPIFT